MTRNGLVFSIVLVVVASLSAQQPPPQGRGGRGGGRGPQGAEPLVIDDHAGFQSIFDGTSLKGWDGDPAFWKAVDGAIVGFRRPDQVDPLVSAAQIELTAEDLAEIAGVA